MEKVATTGVTERLKGQPTNSIIILARYNVSKINGFSAINFELSVIWFSCPADDLRKLSGNLSNLSFLMKLYILKNRISPHSAEKLICNNLEITCLIAKKKAKIFKLVAALTC